MARAARLLEPTRRAGVPPSAAEAPELYLNAPPSRCRCCCCFCLAPPPPHRAPVAAMLACSFWRLKRPERGCGGGLEFLLASFAEETGQPRMPPASTSVQATTSRPSSSLTLCARHREVRCSHLLSPLDAQSLPNEQSGSNRGSPCRHHHAPAARLPFTSLSMAAVGACAKEGRSLPCLLLMPQQRRWGPHTHPAELGQAANSAL